MFSCFKCCCYFYLISLSHLIPFSYLAFLTFNPSHMLLSDWLKETSLCRRNFYFCNVLGQVSWCYLSFLLKLASSWAFFFIPKALLWSILCKTEVYENPLWFYRHRVDDQLDTWMNLKWSFLFWFLQNYL